MKMAAAIVMDESGSMNSNRVTAAQIFLTITEPLDGLGSPVLAIGFRNGNSSSTSFQISKEQKYHRYEGVTYDIFKGWNEKFHSIRWRFANTRAMGGTPMADGIQYALMALKARPETHRFIFVVTDGMPDYEHDLVIKRQIRQAKAAGIYLIGVGIGYNATYVQTLFSDSVWSKTITEFPKLLMAKLNDLVDKRRNYKVR
jgi:cobalamin biosynthesis protein CobT